MSIHKNFKKIFTKEKKGFALLFSIIVAMLVLTIGASIISIGLKQLALSSSGRESQYAFYIANSGLECILYWDTVTGSDGKIFFATSSASSVSDNDMTCFGKELAIDLDSSNDTNEAKTVIEELNVPGQDDKEYCLRVNIKKEGISPGYSSTTIESRGYNMPCGELNNPKASERGLIVDY